MPYTHKHIPKQPRITDIPDNYQELDTLAFFCLAYSNRIFFKSAVHIKNELQLEMYVNTIHVRYLLLLHFTGAANRSGTGVSIETLERNDYPRKDVKRLFVMNDLVKCGLVSAKELSRQGKANKYYKLTDLGKEAINVMKGILHETYLTQPSHQSNKEKDIIKRIDSKL